MIIENCPLETRLRYRIFSYISAFILFISAFSTFNVEAQVDYYHEEFNWSYKGYEWTWSLDIPKILYEAYKSVPVSTRLGYRSSGYGFLTTTTDLCLKVVADELEQASSLEAYDSYDEVSFVLAFVQSLDYTSDSVSSGHDEYPRFPLETLVDNGGDCEDTSMLFATLAIIMGYRAVYIKPPKHFAVGILGEEDLPGCCVTYKGKPYYYCETTGNGWEIGELPSEFRGEKSVIHEIKYNQQYVPESINFSSTTFYPSITPSFIPTSEPCDDFLSEIYVVMVLGIPTIICVVVVSIIVMKRLYRNRNSNMILEMRCEP